MHKIHTKFYHTCSLLVQNATHSITLYTHQHEYCIISSKASCFWPSFQWHFVDGSTIQFTCAIPRFSKVDNHRNQVTPQTFCINRLSNTEKSQRVKMPTTTTTPNLHFQTNNCNYRYKQPIFILLHLDWCLFTITIVIHILFLTIGWFRVQPITINQHDGHGNGGDQLLFKWTKSPYR